MIKATINYLSVGKKTLTSFAFAILSCSILLAQNVPVQHPGKVSPSDTIVPGKGDPDKQIKEIEKAKVKHLSDSTGNEPKKSALVDTTVQNKYGDLLNDDTAYNHRSPLLVPIVETALSNVLIWSMDRYLINADYARIGPSTWKYNIDKGWEWDGDRFGINFVGHPYSGTLYFNAARSTGYNYYQSFPFAVGGSLMWEYFGENTRPSYNDIVNTPVNGAFLGEILYRLSSNLLDDRTRGMQRFARELAAGIIDPVRGVNRLLQGKAFRVTNKEIYQKEPLNVSLYAGIHQTHDQAYKEFGGNTQSELINIQFDYGNPFEIRSRKPFDFFKLRTEFSIGAGRKILDNVTGYGILGGKTVRYAKHSILYGIFQYYDYLDNPSYELGTISFGGGLFSKIPLSKTSEVYTNVHLSLIPLAGNSNITGPDTTQVRDYSFGDGLQGKIESTVNISKYASVSLVYYYYFIHTYVGYKGNNLIGILKPRITIRLFKNLSFGYEYLTYQDDRYLKGLPGTHLSRTEQKIFLLLYLEDKQRRGHYN